MGHSIGKSTKNRLYVQRYGKKGTSQAKVMSNSEKIKSVTLAIVELY